MQHRVTIEGTTVLCNDAELQQLKSICNNFTGMDLSDIETESSDDNIEVLFSDLNKQAGEGEELSISYWGDDDSFPNFAADFEAQRHYNCFFSVLIFLDGCNTFFRSQLED